MSPSNSELQLERRPKRSIHVEIRRTRAAMFIGLGDEHRELSDVAASIWKRCNGELTVGEIAGILVSEYEVDEISAERDAVEFIQALAADGFIL